MTGDFDGDGADELVTVTARSNNFDDKSSDQHAFLNLTAWKCKDGIMPEILVNKYLKDANIYLPSNEEANPQAYIDSYFYRDFSLAMGPFSGHIRQTATATGEGSCCDVALSWAGDGESVGNKRAGAESRQQHVYLFTSELDENDNFKGFADPVVLLEDEVSGAVGLEAGDFAGESVTLEEPIPLRGEGFKSYAVAPRRRPITWTPSPPPSPWVAWTRGRRPSPAFLIWSARSNTPRRGPTAPSRT